MDQEDVAVAAAGEGADACIRLIYHDVLGRAPGLAELEEWVSALRAGTSAENIRAAFLQSDEYKERRNATETTTILANTGLFDAAWYLSEYDDVRAGGADALWHYCCYGWKEDRAPNAYFDPAWYRQTHAVAERENPLRHYAETGEAGGCRPCRHFDPSWYRKAYSLGPHVSPLAHFLQHRADRRHAPCAQLWAVLAMPESAQTAPGEDPFRAFLARGDHAVSPDVQIIQRSCLFDAEHYALQRYNEADDGSEPIAHFCGVGWQEGREPNRQFDLEWYIATNSDVSRLGINPLVHYILVGERTGCRPTAGFSPDRYREVYNLAVDVSPLAHYLGTHRAGVAAQAAETPAAVPKTEPAPPAAVTGQFTDYVDAAWYASEYADVSAAGVDPVHHFVAFGAVEGRAPNRWFDGAWYAGTYPDVDATGVNPLLHYMHFGAAALRNPHYVKQHPEAAANPLLHHMRFGAARDWPTEEALRIDDYLPSSALPLAMPERTVVDVVIPIYLGFDATRRCIESVLDDPDRPPGRIIVIDDCSPDAELSGWIGALADTGRITLLRNPRNLGFVASVNVGIALAGEHDVTLLNSDTQVPAGWLRRLAAHAYASPGTASVSPLSNNATICGYPSDYASPMPFGLDVAALDDACRTANAARSVSVPTTVGFCMYLRRDALDQVGCFDETEFGRGYGEENDFCLRASARNWGHALACDTFVYHEGSVSFGTAAQELAARGLRLVSERHPHYAAVVERHVRRNDVAPFRFAVTAALFRASRLPVLLFVGHRLNGGVQRHIDMLVAGVAGRAHCLLLQAAPDGVTLSVPALPGHSSLTLPATAIGDLLRILRSAGVSRVHVHHLLGVPMDIRRLVHGLDVPLDVTVHDYFAICPQVNLLRWTDEQYCGEPDRGACNACIADRPSYGATDIVTWRNAHAWQFFEAERVMCPSVDLHTRLQRHGLARNAVVVPHEPVSSGPRRVAAPKLRGPKLRVAVLGVLTAHKGAHTVMAVAEAADRATLEIFLIGHADNSFPGDPATLMTVTGAYEDSELPDLLADVQPHVMWFPSSWPETYSFTLSAAIEAGLPIVASRIGAFPERLAGRPLTWLEDPACSAARWLEVFGAIDAALRDDHRRSAVWHAQAAVDFYPTEYLKAPSVRRPDGLVDLRHADRIGVVVVPELLVSGTPTPCAYIRLLQPLDHPQIGADMDVIIADAETALRYRADVILTQRTAVSDLAAADALAEHARHTGAVLLYDLDDDLLHVSRSHPDAERLQQAVPVVERMLRNADRVWVSSTGLAERVTGLTRSVHVMQNGLDERLWGTGRSDGSARQGPVRILYMGTATHGRDLAIVQPALARLKQAFGERVSIDIVGVTSDGGLPRWANRLQVPPRASVSYPGFVNWIRRQPVWDIGLAPLVDLAFNRCKSPIKTLDYAALGMAVVASDVEAYHGSLADGPGGMLVPNDADSWYAALSRLVRDVALRQQLAAGAHEVLITQGTLAAQAAEHRQAWAAMLHRSDTLTGRAAGYAMQPGQ